MMLYPSCSEWTGRLGKGYDQIHIDTSTFPNDGLKQAIHAVKAGFDIDSIKWDNEGGGANGDYLERIFKMAEVIMEKRLDLSSDELEVIDGIIWGHEQGIGDEARTLITKLDKNPKALFKLCEMLTGFDKICLDSGLLSTKTKERLKDLQLIKEI